MTRQRAAVWLLVATIALLSGIGVARLVAKRSAALAARAAEQAAIQGATQAAELALGSALFHGTVPLPARLAGHAELLPTEATRCSNCHEALDRAPQESAAPLPPVGAPDRRSSYAIRLNRAWLTQPRVRRGGPASAYDAVALCTLLRTGVDPAQVLVATVMPRYDATDPQCRAVWASLVRQP